MTLTGEEIKCYLEYSYGNWFNQMSDASDDLLRFKRNEDGTIKYSQRTGAPELEEIYYNYSSAAGINYAVDVSKQVGERVTITGLSNGTPFDLDNMYTVAINSYRGSGGGGHLTRGAGIPQDELSERIITSTDRDIKYNLMTWIKAKKIVTPQILGNVKIVPEEWWEEAKSRDYQLLFESTPEPIQKKSEEPKQ